PREPVLDTNRGMANLTIQAGASLSLAGHDLTVPGTFSNPGTLVLRGTENVAVTQDTGHGTWEYVGDNHGAAVTLKHFGTVDYFNLVIADPDPSDVYVPAADLHLAGAFTLQGGTYDAANFATSVAGVTRITGGTYRAGTGTQTFTNGLVVNGGNFQ